MSRWLHQNRLNCVVAGKAAESCDNRPRQVRHHRLIDALPGPFPSHPAAAPTTNFLSARLLLGKLILQRCQPLCSQALSVLLRCLGILRRKICPNGDDLRQVLSRLSSLSRSCAVAGTRRCPPAAARHRWPSPRQLLSPRLPKRRRRPAPQAGLLAATSSIPSADSTVSKMALPRMS